MNEDTKTAYGVRMIPMTPEVKECFERIVSSRPKPKTPYVCRHTYCSNMAKAGMNPKTLQYLMGHSDIGVTANGKQVIEQKA